MTDLARLVVRLEAETAKYQAGLDTAEKKLVRFEHASNHLADSLKGRLEHAIAAVVGPAALGLLLAHTVEQAARFDELSKATGISVESLSRLNFAARQSGTDLETLNAGLRKLNLSIAEAAGNAKSDAAIAFRAMGVSLRDATGNLRRGDAVLSDVAERFAGYTDGANKSALANAVFGRGFEPLIPLLNEGADGLKRLGDQADATGATISTQTAGAATELLHRVRLLRTSLIDGLGNQLAQNLLPNLNALATIWAEDRGRADELDAIVHILAGTFRGLAAASIIAAGTIQQTGLAIYTVNAAMLDFAHFDFSGGLSRLKEGFKALNANADADLKKLKALFEKNPLLGGEGRGGHGPIRPVIEPPNVEALKAANTQIDKAAQAAAIATKRLLEMDQNLKEQVATFDLTDAAATRYRVTLGSLSDDVLAAGKGGQALAASLIADSEAFDKLKRAKEVAAALVDVNAQINELKGNTAEAVLARFDQQNLELVKKLRLDGNAAGETELATLRKLISAQAAFNLLQEKAERIQADLAIAEERIQNSRLVGALTELDAAKQTSAVRDQAVQDLSAIYEQEKKISDTAGSQDLIDRTKAFGGAIAQLSGQVDLLGQRARATLEEDFGNFFDEAITNIHNLGGAFKHFLDDLAAQLIRFAAQNFAQRLLGAILPSDGGGGGGFASIVSAVFGGGRAGGGDVEPGRAYRVNENTSRSEWFVPASRGVVRPASQMQGLTVQQHFAIEAPQGTVSRQTQQQIGAQAARALAIAQRRNG